MYIHIVPVRQCTNLGVDGALGVVDEEAAGEQGKDEEVEIMRLVSLVCVRQALDVEEDEAAAGIAREVSLPQPDAPAGALLYSLELF